MLRRLLCALMLSSSFAAAQGFHLNMDSRQQAPLQVTFTSDPVPYRLVWDFGDGTTGEGQKIVHTYYQPGTYTFRVEMYQPNGELHSSGEGQLTVKSAGKEKANLVVLLGKNQVQLSSVGSVIYTQSKPQFTLDGRKVGSGPFTLGSGVHLAGVTIQGAGGPTERWVRFRMGDYTTSEAFVAEVLRLTNQARANGYNCDTGREGGRGLPPLTLDAQLGKAALSQSAAMALHNYFDHISGMDGSTPAQRIEAAGVEAKASAENIAVGQKTPAQVVQGWLRSHGHCVNIMGNYTFIGIAYVNLPNTTYKHYWTQVFARR